MTLKMGDIINFGLFYGEVKSQKLPFKILYKLSTLAKVVDEKTEFYREKLQEILREYGELDGDGNLVPLENGSGIKLKPGTELKCAEKVNELLSLEVELPEIKFGIEDFGDIELTMEVFSSIVPFLD